MLGRTGRQDGEIQVCYRRNKEWTDCKWELFTAWNVVLSLRFAVDTADKFYSVDPPQREMERERKQEAGSDVVTERNTLEAHDIQVRRFMMERDDDLLNRASFYPISITRHYFELRTCT
jgi:hypothetical protein